MTKKIEEIFNSYDYGFDLNYVSAEKWQQEGNHYFRVVYLEEVAKCSQPFKIQFNIIFHDNGDLKMVFLEKI